MNKYKNIVKVLFLAILFTCFSYADNPKYIFLFIGDGMGFSHVQAADEFVKDCRVEEGIKDSDNNGLVMTSFPVKGRVTTFSKNREITDSAASSSAFSSGYKVDSGVLNMDASTGDKFEPMAQFAKKNGYKVGIISSAPTNHATPAGFYASSLHRGNFYDIAVQMAAGSIDYIAGPYIMGVDKEQDNIKELAASNGFNIISDREGFDELSSVVDKVWVYSDVQYGVDAERDITLAEHTSKAIELLKDSEGFFMMVEGAYIDWCGHSNDAVQMINEMVDFDQAIKEAVEFYNQNPQDTLIIVTADHETGGLKIDNDRLKSARLTEVVRNQKGSRNIFAKLIETLEEQEASFDEALPKMKEFFGISSLTKKELERVREAFFAGGEQTGDFSYGDTKNITLEWVRIVSERMGLIWGSLSHTDELVPLYAIGEKSEIFAGNLDNALISWYIRAIMLENKSLAKFESDFNTLPYGTFTVAVIPDTQLYYGHGSIRDNESGQPRNPSFDSRTKWLADNIESQNIVFISHMGDIVDRNNDYQWQVARDNMDRFHGIIPYGISVGNHDLTKDGDSSLFQKYFGIERYKDMPWYGGSYTGMKGQCPQISGNNANSYQFFSAADLDFIILHIECNAPDDVLAWAGSVLREHNDKMAIITTHMYLGPVVEPSEGNGRELGRMKWKKVHGDRGNTPEQMWQKLFSKHPNLFLILCGDQSSVISYRQVSYGREGNAVYEVMQDYPRSSDQDDWLRLFRFYPEQQKIKVLTYSPSQDILCKGLRYLPDVNDHLFTLDISEAVKRFNSINSKSLAVTIY